MARYKFYIVLYCIVLHNFWSFPSLNARALAVPRQPKNSGAATVHPSANLGRESAVNVLLSTLTIALKADTRLPFHGG